MKFRFAKMHGLGNDFVIFDAVNQDVQLSSEQLRWIADRNLGVGCDQILVVRSANEIDIDFNYQIYKYFGFSFNIYRSWHETPDGVIIGPEGSLDEEAYYDWHYTNFSAGFRSEIIQLSNFDPYVFAHAGSATFQTKTDNYMDGFWIENHWPAIPLAVVSRMWDQAKTAKTTLS